MLQRRLMPISLLAAAACAAASLAWAYGSAASAAATPPPVRLELRFRPEGAPTDGTQDVAMGEAPPALLLDPGAGDQPAVDALVLGAISGAGRFSAVPRGVRPEGRAAAVRPPHPGPLRPAPHPPGSRGVTL